MNTNKKIIIGLIAIIVLGVGYYLLSPLWNNTELDEASPLTQTNETTTIKDNFENMDEATMSRFKSEVEAMKDKTMVMADSAPEEAKLLSQADFKPRAHDVAGKALLIEKDGQKTLRFENFETINGPDVDIYLATDLSAADFVNLGDLKATKGNVNYAVPASTDTDKYNKVLVWCKAFGVLFSYAELQ
jgi:hypothetical protein